MKIKYIIPILTRIPFCRMFSDRDANVLITQYLSKEDTISMVKTNKRLRSDLYYIPYKRVKFEWTSSLDELKTFIDHSKGVEELIIDRCDIFIHFTINLPKLKKIIIENCTLNLDLLTRYASTLREITVKNCTIECGDEMCLQKYFMISLLSNAFFPKKNVSKKSFIKSRKELFPRLQQLNVTRNDFIINYVDENNILFVYDI